MLVDHERVLSRLKAYIAGKPSHGQRDLLSELGRIESECVVDDERYGAFLRRFGGELEEAFLNVAPTGAETQAAPHPLTEAAASAPAMEDEAAPSIAREGTKEAPCPPNHQQHPTSAPPRPRATALAAS